MKVKLITIIMIVWTLGASAQSSTGIEFFHGTWTEALAQAKEQGKPMFVDIWATWCGPCKRLAAEVFPQPEVGEFFNKHFVCYKLLTDPKDAAEKKLAKKLCEQYHVSAFPTLIWVDSEGRLLHYSTGYRPAEGLLAEGKRALDPEKRMGTLIEKWANGDRSLATGLKYFEVFSDNVEEFDKFFLGLSDSEKCDSNLQITMQWKMRLPAKSTTPEYIASHWNKLYSNLPNASMWKSFLMNQLDDRLKVAENEEAYNAVCSRWRSYELPFTELSINTFICVRYFQEKDYALGYRKTEEMMKQYSDKNLFFIVRVFSELHKQLRANELPAEQRLPVLEKWAEEYAVKTNAWNADIIRIEGYVISGNEAKARAHADKTIKALPQGGVSEQMKEYIEYLLSPLEKKE